MLLEIFIALLLGLLAGTITGLIPGIHINLVGAILISLAASTLYFLEPIYLVVFVVALAITHTFVDFIPSIFLGCPDTDTELSILPGHDLLKKGQGHTAIMLSTYGSLAAIIILAIISGPSLWIIPKFYGIIKNLIPYVLIAISLTLIFLEKSKTKALFAFLLAGILGALFLNLEAIKISEPLLPLLTGLFGASSIIISIKNKTKIPKQIIEKIKPPKLKPLLGATIASPLCSFFPGLGSGQAAIIGHTITKTDKKGFLFLLGATNTLVMGFSFLSLYAIERTRTGAAVAIDKLLGQITPAILILIIATIIITGIASFFLTKKLSKTFASKINSLNYTKISLATISILILVVFFVSGFKGLVLFLASTLTGIYIISLGVRRTNMMGSLLIPTILFYLL